MKRKTLILFAIVLLLSLGLNCYFLLGADAPSLSIQIAKPLTFNDNGDIASTQTIMLEDRTQTDIILLAFINAQPIPTEDAPTAPPDGEITVRYQAVGYPYRLWFSGDDIIIATGSNVFSKIQNDHNNPVPLIRELIDSIRTTHPG